MNDHTKNIQTAKREEDDQNKKGLSAYVAYGREREDQRRLE